MISGWTVYLILKLDSIRGVFLTGTVASGVLFAVLLVILTSYDISADPDDYDSKVSASLRKALVKAASAALLFLTLTVLIPTTRQFALIYIIPKVVNSDFVQKDIPAESRELYELGKDILKQTIKEWRNESRGQEKVRADSKQ